jgi:hypothetical protein
VLTQDAFYHDSQLSANVFTDRPIDGDVLPHGRHQLARDGFQCRFAENFDRVTFVSGAS